MLSISALKPTAIEIKAGDESTHVAAPFSLSSSTEEEGRGEESNLRPSDPISQGGISMVSE